MERGGAVWMGMISRLLMVLTLVPLMGVAADLPAPVLPAGVGVNIHFTRGHERDLDLIAAAGFKVVRMDFSWAGTERKPGEYSWADYDELTTNLTQRGLRAYYILDYSNALYEDASVSRDPVSGAERRDIAAPSKPASIAAFARWAAAAAAHFKGRDVIWEIWNEPNIGFWKPKPNVADYTALVLATCKAVRAADPEAKILAPGSSEFPWEFIEHLFKAGVLEQIDGVSVHPYRSYTKGPETAHEDYRKLRALIERYAPLAKRNLPIISGEWGYATQTKGGVSLATQAAFSARQQLANLCAGVPISIWYDWKNDGPDAAYAEHNFGTVTQDLQPKPSYLAIQTLTRQLAGYRVARRLDGGTGPSWVVLLCNDDGDQKLAAWSTEGTGEFSLAAAGLTAEEVSAVDVTGTPLVPVVADGKLHLKFTAAPQYVTLKRRLPELAAAAAWLVRPGLGTLITAGKPNGVRVGVIFRNPLERPVRARFKLTGLPGVPEQVHETAAEPGEMIYGFAATVHERPAAGFRGTLTAEYLVEDPPGKFTSLGQWSEPLEFQIANPLTLDCAPTAGGLQVRIGNPAREPFAGRFRLGNAEQAIKLTHEQPEATVTFAGTPAAGRLELLDSQDRVIVTAPGTAFRPLELPHLKAALDGDAKVPATASLALIDAPMAGAPYPRVWKLDYQFAAGWRFLRCEPLDAAGGRWQQQPIPGRPRALGMWIHGDGSNNSLRMRLIDATGQTFQPTGPNLAWRGWRWVTFDLTDLKHAGHWGGADDGVPHGDFKLDCPLLVDGSRNETKGTILVAGMAWLE
jgi:hypothetical protein